MRHVTLTLPTMHIILEISSHGSGEGWRTLEIFRLGCAVVVVQVNFAILCWTEPPNKLLPIPEWLFYRNFRGWPFLCYYFLVVCNFANFIFLSVDKTIVLFSAEFVSKLACRTGVVIVIIIIINGGGGVRRTKASAEQVRSTSHVRQGKVQKNCRPAFPCCVCLALLAHFTPDFVPLKTRKEKSMFYRLHGNKSLVHSTWKHFVHLNQHGGWDISWKPVIFAQLFAWPHFSLCSKYQG